MTLQLIRRGEPVKLNWRAAAVLGHLVEARGEVVTREELQRKVWGDVHMDYSVLSQAVLTLRRTLDPPPSGGSYIETVARAGYRLAVEVTDLPDEPSTAVEPAPVRQTRRYWLFAAVIALSLIAAATLVRYSQQAARNHRADELVEKAFHLLRRGTGESSSQAALLFREAMILKPDYPPAVAGIAESAARAGQFTFQHALDQARRAAEDDPKCSECQSILGWILGMRQWRWQESLTHLEQAVRLNGEYAQHRLNLAEWLMVHGRAEEAAREAERATRLEPENPNVWSTLAAARYFQRRYQDSIVEAEKAASLDLHHPSGFIWAYYSHMMLGEDHHAAVGRAKSIAALSTDPGRALGEWLPKFEQALALGGRKGLARFWIDEVSRGRALQVHRYNRARWSMWSGDPESALSELEAGLLSRPYQMIYVAADPMFTALHSSPRYREVVRRVGLPLAGQATLRRMVR